MNGYIRIYRKILENPVVNKDNDYFKVWIYLLLNATHKEMKVLFGNTTINLKPGQLVTGREKISKECNISESKTERILKMLKIEQQIEQQTNSKGRLITIKNWNEYQMSEQQNEQQVNNKRTTSEQQVNTNNNVNNVINIKENNKRKKSFTKPSIEEIELYCKERNNNVNASNFYNFYESKDWMIGKNKMKDWKACVRTWEQRDKKKSVDPEWFNKKISKVESTKEDIKELERLLEEFK